MDVLAVAELWTWLSTHQPLSKIYFGKPNFRPSLPIFSTCTEIEFAYYKSQRVLLPSFPNLRHLKLWFVSGEDILDLAIRLPNLKCLTIENLDGAWRTLTGEPEKSALEVYAGLNTRFRQSKSPLQKLQGK
jgi:hypothetical protein